jgi:predicted DNA-binding protein with PD1-like motif
MTHAAKWMRTPTGYLMVLTEGDDLFAQLTMLMIAEQVPSASLSGFGFAGEVTIGFFDFEKKEYRPARFHQREMTGITGTLAWQDGKPSIHAHGVGGGAHYTTVGGHLLGLTVGRGSLEVTVVLHERRLERVKDEAIGANVLQLAGRSGEGRTP